MYIQNEQRKQIQQPFNKRYVSVCACVCVLVRKRVYRMRSREAPSTKQYNQRETSSSSS